MKVKLMSAFEKQRRSWKFSGFPRDDGSYEVMARFLNAPCRDSGTDGNYSADHCTSTDVWCQVINQWM